MHLDLNDIYNYPFTTRSRLLTALKKKAFENVVGKGETADNQHFLIFPQFFLPYVRETIRNRYFVICKCFEFGPV